MAGQVAGGFAVDQSVEGGAECAFAISFSRRRNIFECQMRIVNVLERIIQKHNKPQDIVAVVYHADPIKLSVAHFLGMPLDHFQRWVVTLAR
jgi:broad specificity phosphatase PhoE